MGSLLKVPIDWIDVEVQKQRGGPNGVETGLGACSWIKFNNIETIWKCAICVFVNTYYIMLKYSAISDACACLPLRRSPLVLPEKLVCESNWPQHDQSHVQQYWENLARHNSPYSWNHLKSAQTSRMFLVVDLGRRMSIQRKWRWADAHSHWLRLRSKTV